MGEASSPPATQCIALSAEHLTRACVNRHRTIETLSELEHRPAEMAVERSARSFGHLMSQSLRNVPGRPRDRAIVYRNVKSTQCQKSSATDTETLMAQTTKSDTATVMFSPAVTTPPAALTTSAVTPPMLDK